MSKRSIVLYMHVHQPYRVRQYSVFDTAVNHNYFDGHDDRDQDNQLIMEKVAQKSYRPMNALLEKLLAQHPEFSLSLSISGTFIEQAEAWAPDVIDSFKRLVDTGRVEIVAETYHHSLAFFYSLPEFERQVAMHRDKVKQVFGVEPQVFRNTELAYNDDLAKWADNYGYKGILAEGWDPILQWRSPNFVYQPVNTRYTKLLLKNYRLSDDLAFRFSNKGWGDYPLTVDKYMDWLDKAFLNGNIVNLFMDYETFGEHQWEETGIFQFFDDLVGRWLAGSDNKFATVSAAIDNNQSRGEISMPDTVTWADSERDLTAWLGNAMQHEVMRYLYDLEGRILQTDDLKLIDDWRKLQTSDHVYYMCTKWFNDGDVHAYFSPYKSPYDAFLFYMNALRDIRFRLSEHQEHRHRRLNG